MNTSVLQKRVKMNEMYLIFCLEYLFITKKKNKKSVDLE